MVLLCHILFNMAITAIAKTIMMWISAEQVPSLRGAAATYFKMPTPSKFWPFMLISALMLLALLVMIWFFLC